MHWCRFRGLDFDQVAHEVFVVALDVGEVDRRRLGASLQRMVERAAAVWATHARAKGGLRAAMVESSSAGAVAAARDDDRVIRWVGIAATAASGVPSVAAGMAMYSQQHQQPHLQR